MRKLILSILGVAIIAISIYFSKSIANSKNRVRPVPVKVVKTVFVDTVKNATIPIVIPANGSLTAKRRVELFSEVQGVFSSGRVLFKPGQTYKKGQTLISISSTEYYSSVQSAKSNLYNAIAAIMPDLRLDFPEVFTKWQTYLNDFDLEKSTPDLPKIDSEKENYFVTGRGIISSYYNVKNLEQRLSKYNISAPFNGVLTEALVTEGTLIRNGQKLGEFIDPTEYEMEVAISKSFVALLKVGEEVNLSNLEKTEFYIGKVTRINGSVYPSTQTVTAYIEVKNDLLKEGMYLEARVNVKEEENAIEIDRNLLLENNEIFVVRDSLLDIVPVRPIYFSDTKVVLKDVPDGTIILSRPLQGAFVGLLVKKYIENKPN